MNDGIEALGSEGKPPGARHDGRRPPGDALNGGSLPGGPQPLFRYVRQNDCAPGNFGQVQPRPASTRTNVEQSVAPSQTQPFGDQIGLRHGRVAVRPEVAPDDEPLQLSGGI